VVGFYFSAKPQRANLKERWPSDAEENLTRLADAGFPYDRQVPKCNNCGGEYTIFPTEDPMLTISCKKWVTLRRAARPTICLSSELRSSVSTAVRSDIVPAIAPKPVMTNSPVAIAGTYLNLHSSRRYYRSLMSPDPLSTKRLSVPNHARRTGWSVDGAMKVCQHLVERFNIGLTGINSRSLREGLSSGSQVCQGVSQLRVSGVYDSILGEEKISHV
jgi:hypothetical protein